MTTTAPGCASSALDDAGRLGRVVADGHALAGGQSVRLDDAARATGREVRRERDRGLDVGERRRRGPSGRRRPRRCRGRTPCWIRSGRRRATARRPRTRPRAAHPRRRPPAAPPGPTTTSSTAWARATATTAGPSSGSTGTQRTRGSVAIPALPGATMTSLTPGSAASFQARACSRPPPPTTRMRVGMIRVTPRSPGGCASGARPVRSSGCAPARPRRARSGRRRATRWR